MTDKQIFSYIEQYDEQYTSVKLKSGVIFHGHFSLKEQSLEDMNQNKWIFRNQGSNDRIDLKGESIESITPGRG